MGFHKNSRPEPHIVHGPFSLQPLIWLQRDRHWSSSKSACSWVRGRVQVHTTFFDKLHLEIYTRYCASQIPPQIPKMQLYVGSHKICPKRPSQITTLYHHSQMIFFQEYSSAFSCLYLPMAVIYALEVAPAFPGQRLVARKLFLQF